MWTDDQRTTEELFRASPEGDYEDEAAWDAVRALRRRGAAEVFQFAARYCQSPAPLERSALSMCWRSLGLEIKPRSPGIHFDERLAVAIKHLGDEDPLVVHTAAWALAHLGGDTAISALIPMRRNPDPDVRWTVANGLNGSERADAIATIIELMDDSDDNVRDWATFALGSQCQVDSPEIRDALRRRLSDSYEMARNEAVWGLAQHKDPQGIRMLIERLSANEWMAGDEMAAHEILGKTSDAPVEELCDGQRKVLNRE